MSGTAKTALKRVIGAILVIFGFAALLIPFFPFAWVALVGLELLGVRVLPWDKVKIWLQKKVKQNQ